MTSKPPGGHYSLSIARISNLAARDALFATVRRLELFACVCANSRLLHTVLIIIKLTKNPDPLRLHCCSGKLIFCYYFIMFCDIMIVVHSLEPGETPSYSASHQPLNYMQRS